MQFTINIPNEHVPRLRVWLEAIHKPGVDPDGNPLPAFTDPELLDMMKNDIRQWLKDQVQQHELLAEHERVFQEYTPIDPTTD